MLAGMGLLTAACVFLGLFPTLFLTVLDPVTLQLTGEQLSGILNLDMAWCWALHNNWEEPSRPWLASNRTLPVAYPSSPVVVVCATRQNSDWADLGLWIARLDAVHGIYSDRVFQPIRMIFKALFRPRREVQREYDYSPYFAKTLRFESHIEEAFVTRLYRPLNRASALVPSHASPASGQHSGLPHLHLSSRFCCC